MVNEFKETPDAGISKAVVGTVEQDDYADKREALMAQLEPHEKALFRLLEHFRQIEKQAESLSATEPKPRISWKYGRNTQQLIDIAIENEYLPILIPSNESGYEVVNWQYGLDENDPENIKLKNIMSKKEYYEYLNNYYRGSFDIRIFLYSDRHTESLKLIANIGSLASMDKDFHLAFDNEPYPVICEDRFNYRYENPAYSAIKNSPK
ncbi:MAG: hypothetical protein H6772_01815 [Pseudomonadales bacterium]|nr:hypothetical protein [Pseudomonadales bacterium]